MTLDVPVDESRPIKVICIGAGIAGITAAIRLPQKIKNLELVLYEKNSDIGGVWFENKYPGIACDIPSHGYQFSFASNPKWSHFYSTGAEIHQYLTKVVDAYDVRKYVKLNHLFEGTKWLQSEGKWEVRVERLSDRHIISEKADIFLRATGVLNRWKWPEIPGLQDFKGALIHSANYDQSFELKNKNLAIIGNGSTGIQIVPALQPIARHIDNYSRSRSWVSPIGPFAALIEEHGGDENFEHTPEEKEFWTKNPDEYHKYRMQIETTLLKGHANIYRGSEGQKKSAEMIEQLVKRKLASRPDVFEKIRPMYPVGCKRLGAGPGYLEALCKDNVTLVSTGIHHVTADGLVDNADVFRPADAIICATGFDTSFNSKDAPIIGQDGIPLHDVWTPEPEAYLGMCAVKMPNLFTILGPNSLPLATMIPMIEFQVEYIVKAIEKIQREHIKSMVVSEAAKNAFIRQADVYFEKTVLTDDCASWLKSGGKSNGRIQALWPGSLTHAKKTLSNPRWEDFEYDLIEDLEGNPLAWMGDGSVEALWDGGVLAEHLLNLDFPPVVKKS